MTLLDHLRPLQQSMREGMARWRALSARDRLAVGIAALLVTLAFLWLVLTRPALDTVARWQQELPKMRAQSTELDRLLAGVPAARGGGAGPSESPQAGLDRAGMQGLYRIQVVVADAPASAGSTPPVKAWRIEFAEPAPADKVFSWLLAVSARSDIEVTGAVLDRADSAAEAAPGPQGLVRGVVDLQSTQLYKDGP
ncbi:type II secretion system protein M [Variovorax paradoxus]|uniref:type II secretion system protein M n=1 Tax=Variovorax paradoxus TaxID=34073 RepID=UPI0021AC1351|nr:type II secretion system protein M [Variovorax paradoxus]UVH57826.1 type II secretion system protein M [Variovorax paradoxus]